MQSYSSQYSSHYSEFPQTDTKHMHTMMDCMSICSACAKYCTEEGHSETAQLCLLCSDVCSLAIKCASCQSEFQDQIMDLCANVCNRCADACEDMDAKHCQECADICRRCAAECENT